MMALNARQALWLDSLGAFLSSVLMYFLIGKSHPFFGIDKSTVNLLTLFPVLFFLYDILFLLFTPKKKIRLVFQGIISLNISYILLSVILCFSNPSITVFGWAYILGEIGLILALVYLEFKVIKRLN